MKRKETLNLSINSEKIISSIRSNISDGSEFDFNVFKEENSITKHNRKINESKDFTGSIEGNVINLYGKGLKYWPKTKIDLTSKKNGGTIIKLKYRGFYGYLSTYIFLLGMFFFLISQNISNVNITTLRQNPIPLIIFLLIFLLLPFFARRKQINLVKYMKKLDNTSIK